MKFLADENVPASVVRMLENAGVHIRSIGADTPGISDRDVMKYALEEERIILTFDKDFGELAIKDTICPVPGVILLRLPGMKPDQLAGFITQILTSRDDWDGHFSVIEKERIRMRPLPPP
ncbi:conserved hypothetical protein [Methanoregula boonei 6A8]|jgi:predicted nuclease of predicted toxin-antitoxin system|uniref:DUF5615 domain-containing protein n=1 Tax=Methanoregula boonei (strain DSM 21154 / JCM 14090 / 6A8) TaxID=456442 RepID=A7I976_METB6|nr:DUF5615 family PIN-like protein [Methanoregula boonei]ABS56287.1 conserved hypothetical protein [Methanoregula boonei 6A8]